MGQKAHPAGLRLKVIRDWESTWFDIKKYPHNLIEDLKIRQHVRRDLKRAGISKIIIKRRSDQIEVNIFAARPGIIIGKGGTDVAFLREELKGMTGKQVVVNIKQVKSAELNARLIAENVAAQLERRVPFRRAMKMAVQRALKMGVLGIKISCSGRLGGAEIARREWYREGRVPLHTLRADIDYSFTEALTTFGKIGVKVWVYHGDILDPEEAEEVETGQAEDEAVAAVDA